MKCISVVQPTIPSYRLGLFNRLSSRLGPRFKVYASYQNLGVLTATQNKYCWARKLGPSRLIMPGLYWQSGVLSLPLERGDVLVVSGAPRTVSNIALIIKAKIKGAKTIWWGHYWSGTSRLWRSVIRFFLMNLADGILFYSEREISEYRTSAWRLSAKPVFALNNGIETAQIASLRAPYMAAKRLNRILFIGRITKKAEIGTLLRALAAYECRSVQLDIIGDGEELNAAKELAKDLGIERRIHWHGGTTDEATISAIANRCRLFVYPGSVGLSLIHGLAYGLPAIVHDDRWKQMPEIDALEPGVNGWTFPRTDAAVLARIIADALADLTRLDKMSAASILATTNSYNMEDMLLRFCAALESMHPGISTNTDPRIGANS